MNFVESLTRIKTIEGWELKIIFQKICPFMLALSCISPGYYKGLLLNALLFKVLYMRGLVSYDKIRL